MTDLTGRERALGNGSSMKVYTVAARGNPGTVRLLKRGNAMNEGEVVRPGAVAALRMLKSDFGIKQDASDNERRRQLARWLTPPDNPLFPRVLVNRLWHHHFGTGIVETPNDFGFNGGRPSHPELLDSTLPQMYALKYMAIDLMTTPDPRIPQAKLGVGPSWEYVGVASQYEARGRQARPLARSN